MCSVVPEEKKSFDKIAPNILILSDRLLFQT